MARSKHFQKRMSQRGMSRDLVDLARQFGEPVQDRVILNRKGIEDLLSSLRQIERTAMKALDKGGVVVVEDGGTLITTYRFDGYDPKKARLSRRQAQ